MNPLNPGLSGVAVVVTKFTLKAAEFGVAFRETWESTVGAHKVLAHSAKAR